MFTLTLYAGVNKAIVSYNSMGPNRAEYINHVNNYESDDFTSRVNDGITNHVNYHILTTSTTTSQTRRLWHQ